MPARPIEFERDAHDRAEQIEVRRAAAHLDRVLPAQTPELGSVNDLLEPPDLELAVTTRSPVFTRSESVILLRWIRMPVVTRQRTCGGTVTCTTRSVLAGRFHTRSADMWLRAACSPAYKSAHRARTASSTRCPRTTYTRGKTRTNRPHWTASSKTCREAAATPTGRVITPSRTARASARFTARACDQVRAQCTTPRTSVDNPGSGCPVSRSKSPASTGSRDNAEHEFGRQTMRRAAASAM
jgi:hypothetical protein